MFERSREKLFLFDGIYSIIKSIFDLPIHATTAKVMITT